MTALALRTAGAVNARQPAARRGHARDVGADLAGQPRRAAAGHARSPTACTCRPGCRAEMAAAVRHATSAPTGSSGTTTRRSGTRVLDDPRRGAVGVRAGAAHVPVRVHPRARARSAGRDEHVSAARVVAAGTLLDPNALTIGFARRFTGYKRPELIFHDPERLARILNAPRRPVQIVFAGKAHPADETGKHHLQQRLPARARSGVRRPHRVRRRLRPARRALPRAGLRRVAEQPAQAARGERHQRHEGRASTACRT